ncbi:MAG: hypothetical protein KGD64_00030 [Candidatus Heimdallarchaeota archaeon]|nr:hypothetical protein [Candidatus Heimdallarchaeota archaeon]
MFDIKEFYKARKRLFENQNQIYTLSDLQDHLSDLDMVCANERSSEIADLLLTLIDVVKPFNDNQALFELYWQYFLQTYYYVKQLDKTETIISKMKSTASRTKCIENTSRVYEAESLISQLKGQNNIAIASMQKALTTIESQKQLYPDIYYSALYSHSYFTFLQEHNVVNTIEKMEECLTYYSKSKHMRGLIIVIHQLLKFYLFSGNEEKIEQLLLWVFENRRIQDNMLDNHYVLFNWNLGNMFTVRNKLEQAIEYLQNAYMKIIDQKLQMEMMYEYADILKFLSRCYAYLGKFQDSYDTLVELISFMEKISVKENYYSRGKKSIFMSSYYTLLFIFVQLDLNIENIKNEKLRRVYEYTNELLEKSEISEDLILSTFSDDKQKDNLLDSKNGDKDELSVILHQMLLTHTPYQNPKKNMDTITSIRKYAFDPLYADILLGKIQISIGNYEKFKEITLRINTETNETKAPIIRIWRDFFLLLEKYIENPDNKEVQDKLVDLAKYCKENNFIKMEEEIELYHRLISSTRTINQFTKKIKQTAFMDMYDKESKRMAIEYLESNKNP